MASNLSLGGREQPWEAGQAHGPPAVVEGVRLLSGTTASKTARPCKIGSKGYKP